MWAETVIAEPGAAPDRRDTRGADPTVAGYLMERLAELVPSNPSAFQAIRPFPCSTMCSLTPGFPSWAVPTSWTPA